MYFGYFSAKNWYLSFYGSQSVQVFSKSSGNPFNEAYRDITISDGQATTWKNLIKWFENNAIFTYPNYYVNGEQLKSIADTIRSKSGTSALLEFPSGFVTAINDITTPIPSNYGLITYNGSILTVS
jgi:hypothetical protein